MKVYKLPNGNIAMTKADFDALIKEYAVTYVIVDEDPQERSSYVSVWPGIRERYAELAKEFYKTTKERDDAE